MHGSCTSCSTPSILGGVPITAQSLRCGDEAASRRSRVETKMHCVKLLGQRLAARDFDRQVAEFQIRVAVLNGFTALGIPNTETVG